MSFDNLSDEVDAIYKYALGEANRAKQLQAGGDHILLALLASHYGTASKVLFRYNDLEEDARTIVRKLTPSWWIRKRGKVRLATSSSGFMRAHEFAAQKARELRGADATLTELDLLEAILRIGEENLLELLRQLNIPPFEILEEIDEFRKLSVEN